MAVRSSAQAKELPAKARPTIPQFFSQAKGGVEEAKQQRPKRHRRKKLYFDALPQPNVGTSSVPVARVLGLNVVTAGAADTGPTRTGLVSSPVRAPRDDPEERTMALQALKHLPTTTSPVLSVPSSNPDESVSVDGPSSLPGIPSSPDVFFRLSGLSPTEVRTTSVHIPLSPARVLENRQLQGSAAASPIVPRRRLLESPAVMSPAKSSPWSHSPGMPLHPPSTQVVFRSPGKRPVTTSSLPTAAPTVQDSAPSFISAVLCLKELKYANSSQMLFDSSRVTPSDTSHSKKRSRNSPSTLKRKTARSLRIPRQVSLTSRSLARPFSIVKRDSSGPTRRRAVNQWSAALDCVERRRLARNPLKKTASILEKVATAHKGVEDFLALRRAIETPGPLPYEEEECEPEYLPAASPPPPPPPPPPPHSVLTSPMDLLLCTENPLSNPQWRPEPPEEMPTVPATQEETTQESDGEACDLEVVEDG